MKKLKNSLKQYLSPEVGGSITYMGATMLMCMLPEIASALPTGPDTLDKLALSTKEQVQGSMLMITLNAAGVVSILFSMFNGFSKAPLVAGGLLLLFTNIYFPYVNTNFTISKAG